MFYSHVRQRVLFLRCKPRNYEASNRRSDPRSKRFIKEKKIIETHASASRLKAMTIPEEPSSREKTLWECSLSETRASPCNSHFSFFFLVVSLSGFFILFYFIATRLISVSSDFVNFEISPGRTIFNYDDN